MRETNIATAQREYYKRPEDERFTSFRALIDAAALERSQSQEAVYNLRDLRAVRVTPNQDGTGGNVLLQSPSGAQAAFTHYSFGQLCKTIGGSFSRGTALLRDLPPAITADALNYGIQDAAAIGTRVNMLVRDDPQAPTLKIRACTSETYGRVWDAQLYGELDRHFGDGKQSANAGGTWMTPPAWPGSLPSGNYRGDRDSFVIRVDGGSIVTDPSAGQGDSGQLYRGIMVRNSEVGHCSITLECVLYRYICGNHMLWGAVLDRRFARRHVGKNAVRDTIKEINDLAWKFNVRAASTDESIIRSLIQHEIAQTREGVIDELQKIGYTKEQATEAYATCEAKESASPRSYWGIAQGTTRNSQESGHQDDRLALDRLAAQVLKRGALVTV